MAKIKSKATPNIHILGYQSNKTLVEHMSKAKAFVFAAEEDFGITPVEAQACGTPVIAFGKGGIRDYSSIRCAESNGLFFDNQKVADIINAIQEFEKYPIKFYLLTVDLMQ